MNEQNLKPFNTRTESEQREIRKAGGIASGEARRLKRTLRELAEQVGEFEVTLTIDGREEDVTYLAAVVMKQYHKAIFEADTAAAKFIQNVLGEEQVSNVQQTIYNVSAETAAQMRQLEQSDI